MKTLKILALLAVTNIFCFTSCQKEVLEDTQEQMQQTTDISDEELPTTAVTQTPEVTENNPLIEVYVGESMVVKNGSEAIHNNMTGDFIEYITTSDTTYSQLDTVFIIKDLDNKHFKILGSGAISQINEFAYFSFNYDMQSEFEISDGNLGYNSKEVKLLFDEAGKITVNSYFYSIYDDRPIDGYCIKFSGFK